MSCNSYNNTLKQTKEYLSDVINKKEIFSPLIYFSFFDILFCFKNKNQDIRTESLKLYIDSMTKFCLEPSPRNRLQSILKNNYYGFNFSIIDQTDTKSCIKKDVLYHHLESTGVFLFLIIDTYGQ